MAKVDISGLSLDELTTLIDEATKLRAGKVDAKRRELQSQLAALDALGTEAKPATTRSPAKPLYRGPDGETFSGRGAIPRWAKALGVIDRKGLEKYRIKD